MNDLTTLRVKIDTADHQLLLVLSQRIILIKAVGLYKNAYGLKPLDRKRWHEVLKNRVATGKSLGLSPKVVQGIFQIIHRESLHIQGQAKP